MPLRLATVADAPALARVHMAAWRAAYRGIMASDYLDAMDAERFASGWERNLETGARTTVGTLTDLPDAVIEGFCSVGPAREGSGGATGEVWALNLHPRAFGTGLAKELHDDGLERLIGAGHSSVCLWVATENPRARRFYEREGWVADGGAKDDEIGGALVAELRYARRLA